MRFLVRGCALLAAAGLAGVFGALPAGAAKAPVPASQVPPEGCMKYHPGGALPATPWAQTQLNFDSLWSITEGRSVTTGQPVVVGVVDSGFDARNPQIRVNHTATFDAVHPVNDANAYDCVGHGTEVTSIIAADPGASPLFHGVAPQVKIVPIKYTNGEQTTSAAPLVRALKFAVDQHVDIINLSSGNGNKPTPALIAQFERAEKAGIVVVVAGGNDADATSDPTVYPAALSTRFPNMIAVSAVDKFGSTGSFSTSGNYIDVAAPGVGVDAGERVTGFKSVMGTSYAAAFVTGTAALMLAAHPGLSPESIKDRIEATADPPPAAVPDKLYGYGILNPVLAVTGTQNDTVTPPPVPRGARVAPPLAQKPADRSLQHHALAVAIILLGLAVLVIAVAATLRGSRSPGRAAPRTSAPR
jgi:membrane-anchored mycosin MYCP